MDDVLAIAERGVELLGEGLVAVSSRDGVVVVALHEGRAGRAEGPPEELARLVRAAGLRARQPRAWRVPHLPPAHVGEAETGTDVREAVATTWGTRTFEARALSAAPGGTGPLPDRPCVLAPAAVAVVLAALGSAVGVDLALGAEPPAARSAVTLVDDAAGRRAFDAEGVPRQRVTIIERGAFAGGVRDAASPPSTGHATRPLTLAPRADHLALLPGAGELVADVHDLAPLRAGAARRALARIAEVGADGAARLA